MLATIDFLPTFGQLAGYEVPQDRYIDGCDQTELLLGNSKQGARSDYFYFCMNELHAVRQGDWKLILADRRFHYGYVKDKGSNEFELYNLREDIGEQRNLASQYPDLVKQLMLHATSVPQPDSVPNNTINLTDPNSKTADAIGEIDNGRGRGQGLRDVQRQRIRAAFEKGISQRVIPGGAALIISRGEVVFREAFGVCDVESQRPFTVDTPCRIASVTKPHTATLLVMLAEQGKLDLDTPVDAYLPEFHKIALAAGGNASRAPTLRECLSHTAGFPGNSSEKQSMTPANSQATLAETVRSVARGGLRNEPGRKYDYSRMGYQVAGRVAEVVTGRMYQDLMRRNLIEPLGMRVASFTPAESEMAKLARQYSRTRDGTFVPRRAADLWPPINPGGSLISSLDDVARLMLLHRNQGKVGERQIVSADTLRQMYVPQPATPGTGYGLGFNIMKQRADGTAARIRHTGASGTLAMLDFDEDLIVVVFTQVDQTQINNWRNQLLAAIADALE